MFLSPLRNLRPSCAAICLRCQRVTVLSAEFLCVCTCNALPYTLSSLAYQVIYGSILHVQYNTPLPTTATTRFPG